MRYLLYFLLGYIVYKLVRFIIPKITSSGTTKGGEEASDSLGIREEDIRDAEYKDLED